MNTNIMVSTHPLRTKLYLGIARTVGEITTESTVLQTVFALKTTNSFFLNNYVVIIQQNDLNHHNFQELKLFFLPVLKSYNQFNLFNFSCLFTTII